jgi:hypothetical protein
VLEELLVALFRGGHCILEGVPGLGALTSPPGPLFVALL